MRTTFSRKELMILFELMEDGKIHYCPFCSSFVNDSVWPIHISEEKEKKE